MTKDFVNLGDFSGEQLQGLLDRALADKALYRAGKLPASCPQKTLAMVFQKPSLRTRVSFEAAMTHLGGAAIYLAPADIGLGQREGVDDVARVLGRMCDAIMARTFEHELIEGLARHAGCPVINGLSDYSHPCQAMADLMTTQEWFARLQPGRPPLAGRKFVFVGDANNVARSLAVASVKLGVQFVLAAPEGYELGAAFEQTLAEAGSAGSYELCRDPRAAVADADVIYTDTWVSMGQEAEKEKRKADFAGFCVNADLLAAAADHAIVLHCLPAYKGCEISAETFEAHAASIFEQSENRLHVQRTLLNTLIAEGGIR